MTSVSSVHAFENRGLLGDRYYFKTGYYSNKEGWGANVTLIAQEAIDQVNNAFGLSFTGRDMRRNIVTVGVDVTSLLDKEFRCGEAIFRGTKDFPPCMRLAHLTGSNAVLKHFAKSCGIGAQVVASGEISQGNAITLA